MFKSKSFAFLITGLPAVSSQGCPEDTQLIASVLVMDTIIFVVDVALAIRVWFVDAFACLLAVVSGHTSLFGVFIARMPQRVADMIWHLVFALATVFAGVTTILLDCFSP